MDYRSLSGAACIEPLVFVSGTNVKKEMSMKARKIAVTALGTLMILSTTASFATAAPGGRSDHKGRWMSPEAGFVYLLKNGDANKDFKIDAAEFDKLQDDIFARIDKDTDGVITPKEVREDRMARIAEFRAEREKLKAEADLADDSDEDNADAKPEAKHDGKHDKKHSKDAKDRKGPMRHANLGMLRFADTDENGQVNKAEMKEAAEKLFKRLDRNGDGAISIEDLPNRPFL
jgi:Ca2+-binding EF-hand superfamily protein